MCILFLPPNLLQRRNKSQSFLKVQKGNMTEKDEKGWSVLKGAMLAVKDAFPTSLVPLLNETLAGVLALIDHVEVLYFIFKLITTADQRLFVK